MIITDPWWAPAIEEQAEDRCHRLGQQNPVEVVRLVARDSIEEKILAIAGKKHELMQGLHKGKDGAALVQTKMLGSLFDAPWFRGKKRPRSSSIDGA